MFVQENLKTAPNERLNNKICITFKETFSNSNLDKISEIVPKVHSYNNEISKFIQEINIKYGILLNCTVLEVSEVLHWAETFKGLVRLNVHQEVHLTQCPWPCLSPPPQQTNINLNHQWAEINMLMQVTQQWSA